MTMGSSIFDQAPGIPTGAPIVAATICAGSGEGQSIKLRRATSLFGTKRGCKFVLRHPTVCRRHCIIINNGQRVILRDLDTHGKTFRNGLKVEQEYLEDADRITIGPWEFRIDVEKPEVEGSSDSPAIFDLEPDPTVLAIEDPATRQISKLPREVSILGRSPGCDHPILDREVSGVHAVIFSYLHRPVIFDLDSENGTMVNGSRAVFAMLHDGDEIMLGTHTLIFRCNASPRRPDVNGSAAQVLKPEPFENPEGTISDLIDFSAESQVQRSVTPGPKNRQ